MQIVTFDPVKRYLLHGESLPFVIYKVTCIFGIVVLQTLFYKKDERYNSYSKT